MLQSLSSPDRVPSFSVTNPGGGWGGVVHTNTADWCRHHPSLALLLLILLLPSLYSLPARLLAGGQQLTGIDLWREQLPFLPFTNLCLVSASPYSPAHGFVGDILLRKLSQHHDHGSVEQKAFRRTRTACSNFFLMCGTIISHVRKLHSVDTDLNMK